MARKPCKIKVKLPNGKIVVPELGKQLVDKFGSKEGERLLNSVLSKDFYGYFGNFVKNSKSEHFEGKLDNQEMPLMEGYAKRKKWDNIEQGVISDKYGFFDPKNIRIVWL